MSLNLLDTVTLIEQTYRKITSTAQVKDVQAWIEVGDTIEFQRMGDWQQAVVTNISEHGRIDYEYQMGVPPLYLGTERWYTETHKVIGLAKRDGSKYGSAAISAPTVTRHLSDGTRIKAVK
ncbi:MAG: hypothetical protein SF123_09740 [Chloroflexota bacterium]|nr:hypothetical protein [Chloroflexota bacterium]